MKEELISQTVSLLIQIFVVVILPVLFTKVFQFLNAKKMEVEGKVGKQNYDLLMGVANSIYFVVEEKFKNYSRCSDNKKVEFDTLLKGKFPHLKQEDIDHIRQSIVGEFNKQTQLQPIQSVTTSGFSQIHPFNLPTNSYTTQAPPMDIPPIIPPNCVSETVPHLQEQPKEI